MNSVTKRDEIRSPESQQGEGDRTMETCYNYTGKVAYFSSDERKWINKVCRMKEQYPDQVEILKQPEENDGCIYARLPAEWMRMQPKRVVELSEEEKQVLRDRLARVRADAS